MKKVLLIILISFLGRDLIGQPITKRGGASVTVNDENLFVGKSFRVPVFTDTTAANLAVTLDSAGKLIFTYDINGLWLRESNPKKWARVGSGGGSGSGIVSLGIVGNYGLTRINDSTYRVDTLLIATRARLMHVADSLLAIIGAKPSGSGTTDYLARWTNSTTLGIGATRDDGTNVGIGVAPGTYKLNVNGSLNVASSIYLPSSASTTGNIYKNNTKWLHNGGLAGSSLTNIYLGNNAGNDTALFYNIGIGQDALKLNNGYGNIALGAYAMAVMAGYDGGDNSSNGIAIGAEAMKDATGGHRPIAIGTVAGQWFNGSSVSVIAIGKTTAAANYGGVGSTYVGASIASLGTKDTADWNAIVGADAFEYIGKAHGNSSVGALIASGATTASYNTAAGFHALNSLVTGDFNNAVGYYAGAGIVAGTNNVHIGRFADAYGGDYSNKLVINSTSGGGSRHLINGDFIDGKVGINRTLSEIAAGSQALQVNGNIYGTQNLKLGGIPAGIGNKVVMFDLSDSTFRLKDTTGWGGGGGTPGGANTEIQFNNSGAFGASANFTWNGSRMSTIAATIGSTSTPDATSPLTIDAASTNTAYLLQMGKNGNPAYFRIDKDGNITDIGGGAAPISSAGGKPNFTSGFASTSWASNSEGNAILRTDGGTTLPWILNTSSSTTDNLVSFRVTGNNAATKGDIQQWTDNSNNILARVGSTGIITTVQDANLNSIVIGQGTTSGLSHLRIGSSTTLASVTAGSLLNTAIGIDALRRTTTGDYNVAIGYGALEKDTLGSDGIGIGRQAGQNNNGTRNVFVGGAAGVNCLTCDNSIYIENSNGSGNGASTGDYNIVIANKVANLSPSLHNSIVIADSVDIVIMKDSSGKMYINAPNTIIGSQGVGNSTLQSAGSFSAGYVAKTGTYTLTELDYTVEATSGTWTATLPTAVGCAGRFYFITNSGGGTITVATTSSQVFRNVVTTPTTLTLATLTGVTVQSNGSDWLKVSSF